MLAIVDAGPLYATVDTTDADHHRSLAVLQRPDLRLIIPALVIAEVTYLIGRRLGSTIEAAFLRGLQGFDVVTPAADDWLRIGELVERYANFPLGGSDASVVALAERLGTEIIITLDHRHFRPIRPRHCSAFRLLPA
jgi:uncharacterized protein